MMHFFLHASIDSFLPYMSLFFLSLFFLVIFLNFTPTLVSSKFLLSFSPYDYVRSLSEALLCSAAHQHLRITDNSSISFSSLFLSCFHLLRIYVYIHCYASSRVHLYISHTVTYIYPSSWNTDRILFYCHPQHSLPSWL